MYFRWVAALASACALTLSPYASAQQHVSFEGETIKMIVPTTTGGSTDIAARLIARSMEKYLPGNPKIIIQNMPGGHGVAALNFVAQQAKPDGLTITLASNSQTDPIVYRSKQARYNPLDFKVVGAIGFGDNIMIIRSEAFPRLLDKSKAPVSMGSVSGAPRSGMRMTIFGNKFLGWNTKWVTGYPGSPDLVLALERGEIDMTSFPRFYVTDKLTDKNKYKIIYLDGLAPNSKPSGRADADNAPLFTKAIEGKIKDPKYLAAYNYWKASKLFKWLALAPATSPDIVDVYQGAFNKMIADPEFKKVAEESIEGYSAIVAEDAAQLIKDLAETPDEALTTTDELLRQQGLEIPKSSGNGEKKSKS
jgi:tripartite-type tricarboxylate transporter receptor subunit TctC